MTDSISKTRWVVSEDLYPSLYIKAVQTCACTTLSIYKHAQQKNKNRLLFFHLRKVEKKHKDV